MTSLCVEQHALLHLLTGVARESPARLCWGEAQARCGKADQGSAFNLLCKQLLRQDCPPQTHPAGQRECQSLTDLCSVYCRCVISDQKG